MSDAPNKRRQDGIKRDWLCTDCEQRLSGFGREFAKHIFHPTIEQDVHRIAYERWLLKLRVSLSWRALLMTGCFNSISRCSETRLPACIDRVARGRAIGPRIFKRELLALRALCRRYWSGVDSIRITSRSHSSLRRVASCFGCPACRL